MSKLPRHYAPFVYGVIQAGLTTAVATAIATHQAMGLGPAFLQPWLLSWLIAWATMLPVVLFAAPLIQWAVLKVTQPPVADRHNG